MPFTIPEALADLPEAEELIQEIVTMVSKEKTETTWAAKQKDTEGVQEKLAALIDVIEAQVKS